MKWHLAQIWIVNTFSEKPKCQISLLQTPERAIFIISILPVCSNCSSPWSLKSFKSSCVCVIFILLLQSGASWWVCHPLQSPLFRRIQWAAPWGRCRYRGHHCNGNFSKLLRICLGPGRFQRRGSYRNEQADNCPEALREPRPRHYSTVEFLACFSGICSFF